MAAADEAPKICHVTSVHDARDGRIFHRECVTLANAGYHVAVVGQADQDAELAGVRIRAIGRPRGRWQRMTGLTLNAYRIALDENADLYHVHDPELLPFAFLLRLKGKRVIYDAHEDLPDDIMTKDWIPRWLRAPLAFAMSGLIRITGVVCSGIVAATPQIAKRFPPAKTALVQNFPRVETAANEASAKYSERPMAVLYLGSITAIRGIVQMVDAFARAIIPASARLVIAGSFGVYSDSGLERRVRSSAGWERVDFLGWQPPIEIERLLDSMRVGLVLFHPNKAHLEAQPTKLFEYMRAGIPVIVSDFPLWRDIVNGADCGIVVDPLDCDAIAVAIAALLNDSKRAEAMGLRGQEAVRSRYCWAKESDRLIALYESLFYHVERVVVQHA